MTEERAPATTPWVKTSYSDEDIAAAVAKVNAMAGDKDDANKIPTFWPHPKVMPTISAVDFGKVAKATVTIADLYASNTWVKRDRLLWHIQNIGLRLNTLPGGIMFPPLVGTVSDSKGRTGDVIIDGHHSIGALMVLGAASAPVWRIPMNPQAGKPPKL